MRRQSVILKLSWVIALLAPHPHGVWATTELPTSDPESIESPPEIEDHGMILCSLHLRTEVQKSGGTLSPQRLMQLRLSDPNYADPQVWFQKMISKNIRRALQTQIDRGVIAERGLGASENYFVIQQLNLKELNEELLDIGGTQYYLQALDDSLYSIFEEAPQLGKVVNVNYKDRAIVSSLTSEQFEQKVMVRLRERTLKYIGFLAKESGERLDWEAYLKRSLAFHSGRSIERALFELRLSLLGLSEENWRMEIKEIRATLLFLKSKPDSLTDLLKEFRQVENYRPATLNSWVKSHFTSAEMPLDLLRRYMKLLAVADMLPMSEPASKLRRQKLEFAKKIVNDDPKRALDQFKSIAYLTPDAWSIHRSRFLRASLGRRIIISTDMKGLGAHALADRERWVEQGAHLSELSRVYEPTTQFVRSRTQEFSQALRYAVGVPSSVDYYTSGDDGLWSLPMLSPDRLTELKDVLQKFAGDFYFHIEIVEEGKDDEDIRRKTAAAVNSAWKALFQSKATHKLLSNDQQTAGTNRPAP
jgi:hypothetical protein